MDMMYFKRLDRNGFWLGMRLDESVDTSTNRDTLVAGMDKRLDEIQEWTKENNIGVRMAYDMWRFNNEKDMMAFMLKWN